MNSFPQIVVGTYEEFVLGYNLKYESEKKTKCKLHQSFATHTHQASVRCIAAYNHLMASSGADEYINIYDMAAMEVSTVINYHNATVTCLDFTPDGSHLVTANQNGDIAIFRCKDWTLVKFWKEAHKHSSGVLSVSIHPTGSLLLTTGADNIVRFWNLVKGRQAYATNFSKKCSIGNSLNFGIWSKNGNYYAICIGSTLEIYKTKTAALVYEIKANTRIVCSTFTKKNLICFGTEDGFIEVHYISEKKLILKKKVHKNRVKSLSSFGLKVCKKDNAFIKNYIVSVDSTGEIKLWFLKKKQLHCSFMLRGETDCNCRITCLALVDSKDIKTERNNVHEVLQNVTQESQDEEVNTVDFKRQTNKVKKKSKILKHEYIENGSGQPAQIDKRIKSNFRMSSYNKCT